MKLIFLGTPEFALPSLTKLCRYHQVVLAITRPDKPKGRKLHLAASPVKEFAVKNSIPILQPETLNNQAVISRIQEIKPDAAIVAAYGQIIPKWLLELPSFGCLNLHASLLPEYRGAAPIQRAILDGKNETGVTTMLMDEGLDTGAVLLQASLKIEPDDNAGSLSQKLAEVGSDLILETLRKIENNTLSPKPQDANKATTAPKLSKEEMAIDWIKDNHYICRLVRALAPQPGAFTFIKHLRVKIQKAEPRPVNGPPSSPGKIVSTDKELAVAAGSGLVALLAIQPEGKKVMTGAEFVRGHRLEAGDIIGASR